MVKRSELDQAFFALADGSRRSMVQRLTHGAATVGELAAPLGISLPAVMQHLAVLEDAGLVRTRKQGRVRHCELDRGALHRTERWMTERRLEAERSLDRLEAWLVANPEAGGESA